MLFITGLHCSGKTVAKNLILKKNNFFCFDLGPCLRNIFKKSSKKSFKKWIKKGESVYGDQFTDKVLVKYIKEKIKKAESKHKGVAIIGNRSFQGLKYIQNNLADPYGQDDLIVYIEAPDQVLQKRWNKRENTNLTVKEFRNKILNSKSEKDIKNIKERADKIIQNNCEFKKFKEKMKVVVKDYFRN